MFIQSFTLSAAIVTAFFIYLTWRTSKKSLTQQSFTDLEKEYRTPLVGASITLLWSIYKDYNKDIDEMIRRYKIDWEKINIVAVQLMI